MASSEYTDDLRPTKGKRPAEWTTADKIEPALRKEIPMLMNLVTAREDSFKALRIINKGNELFVVLTADVEGKAMVMFSSAMTLEGALSYIEHGMKKDRWREDKPYVKEEKR